MSDEDKKGGEADAGSNNGIADGDHQSDFGEDSEEQDKENNEEEEGGDNTNAKTK